MADSGEGQSTGTAVFRRRGRGAVSTRKRHNESSESSSDGQAGDVVKTTVRRPRRKNPMIQSTNKRKVVNEERKEGDSETSSSESGKEGTAEVEGAFKSSGTAERSGPADMGATATNEMDTDVQHDAQAQFERVQKAIKDGHDDKVYLGAAMYGAKEKKDTVRGNAASGMNRVGPIRAPNFLRQSVRWDFAPDICKDYKETGFCTFGDSCKFLHDRTDYKHGWEIERDYAAGRMEEEDADKYVIHSSDEEDCNLPFKCFICRESFTNPVVTKCKHYFCEKCALGHFRKTPKCFVCDQNTLGVFNVAKDLIAKLKENEEKREEPEGDDGDSSKSPSRGDEGEDTKIEMLAEEGKPPDSDASDQ